MVRVFVFAFLFGAAGNPSDPIGDKVSSSKKSEHGSLLSFSVPAFSSAIPSALNISSTPLSVATATDPTAIGVVRATSSSALHSLFSTHVRNSSSSTTATGKNRTALLAGAAVEDAPTVIAVDLRRDAREERIDPADAGSSSDTTDTGGGGTDFDDLPFFDEKSDLSRHAMETDDEEEDGDGDDRLLRNS